MSIKYLGLIFVCGLFSASNVYATAIDSVSKYSYAENSGWLNWGTPEGAVDVGATSLTGYVWGENIGWLSLNCSNTSSCGTVNYSVTRDGSGNLAGYAWSENSGWVSFNCSNTSSCGSVNYLVSIDAASGDFSGYAYGENLGWVSFNCLNTSSCGTVSYKTSLLSADQTAQSTGSSYSSGDSSRPFEPNVISNLPPPTPMFPSGPPPKFFPPVNTAHAAQVQPGGEQEAVSKFAIPSQITEKVKLIFELTVSAAQQGVGAAVNLVVRVWNIIKSFWRPGNLNLPPTTSQVSTPPSPISSAPTPNSKYGAYTAESFQGIIDMWNGN